VSLSVSFSADLRSESVATSLRADFARPMPFQIAHLGDDGAPAAARRIAFMRRFESLPGGAAPPARVAAAAAPFDKAKPAGHRD